jgi:hypothetical protein
VYRAPLSPFRRRRAVRELSARGARGPCAPCAQDGKIVEKHQIELPNIYPQEGWCEHDPAVIMEAVTTCIDETMKKVEGRYTVADVAAIGVRQGRACLSSALSAACLCTAPCRWPAAACCRAPPLACVDVSTA